MKRCRNIQKNVAVVVVVVVVFVVVLCAEVYSKELLMPFVARISRLHVDLHLRSYRKSLKFTSFSTRRGMRNS